MTTVDVLGDIQRQLDAALCLDDVLAVVRSAARMSAGSEGATVVFREDDKCFYADEDSIAPLWKGQRFPMRECISGWAMLHQATAVVPDISIDHRIPQDAYRPTYVRSLAMVPIRREAPIGAIGAYWARRHTPTADEVARLERLADLAAAAIDRVGLTDAPWAPNFANLPR